MKVDDVMGTKTAKTPATRASRNRGRFFKPSRAAASAPIRSGSPKLAGYKIFNSLAPESIRVETLRKGLGVSQEELARVTGYSTRSIAGWEGGQALTVAARQRLTETERLRAALAEIMPASSLGEWLRTPNPAFEGQRPIQIIERGESDRLWRMIFQINGAVAS